MNRLPSLSQVKDQTLFLRSIIVFAHLLGIGGFFIVIRVGRVRLMGFYLVLTFSLILFDVLYLIVPKLLKYRLRDESRMTKHDELFNPRLALISLLLSFCTLSLFGQSLGFLLVIAVTITMGIGVIWTNPQFPRRLIGLSAVLISSLLLMVSEATKGVFYSGHGDPVHHLAIVDNILNSGHLAGVARPRLMPYLLFHTGSSVVARLTNLDSHTAALLFVTLTFQLALLSIFLFVRLENGHKTAVIAVAILATLPPVVTAGSMAHYRALSFVFLALFIFLVTIPRNRRIGVVLFLVTLAWVLTHHVSIILASVFFAGIAVSFIVTKGREYPVFYFTILGLLFGYYYTTRGTIGGLFAWIFFTSAKAQGITAGGYQVVFYENLVPFVKAATPIFLTYIYYIPLLGFGGYGLYRIVRHNQETANWKYVWAFSIPAIVIFVPNPFWLFLEGIAEIPRWHLVAAPFFSIIMAIGIKHLLSSTTLSTSSFHIGWFMFVILFFLVLSAPVNGDLVDMSGYDRQPQRYITSQEMAMVDHTLHHPPDKEIRSYSDIPVYLSKHWPSNDSRVEISQLKLDESPMESRNKASIVLFSEEVLSKNAIGMKKCRTSPNDEICTYAIASEENYKPGFRSANQIYTNGGAEIYLVPGGNKIQK